MSDAAKLAHFRARTKAHIQRVQANAAVLAERLGMANLLLQVASHDASKYEEPEFSAYVEITWMYRCKRLGEPFEWTDAARVAANEATFHHVRANRHHPEHWAPEAAINLRDRDAPPGLLIDARDMDDMSLAEMCCDWVSMSQEKLGTNSAHKWAEDNLGVRWLFTLPQVTRIYQLLDVLQEHCSGVTHATQG